MALVGFDTALPVTSACVLVADGSAFKTPAPPPERLLGAPRHSEELLPELDRLLREAGIGWGDVESIAVGVGPGTFTGLRIGIATARALGQALRIPIRPVSSLEALASGSSAEARRPAGSLVLPLIDARRGQVFAALYRVAPGGLESVWEAAALDPPVLLERVQALPQTPLGVGDWAIESRTKLELAGAEVPAADSGLHAVDALHVCRLGKSAEPVPPERVRPDYLRLPDAELHKQAALEKRDDA